MSTEDLLLELGVEELPPKSLRQLGQALHDQLLNGLKEAGLTHAKTHWYASPRRLAVQVEALQSRQNDESIERRGPAVKAAFNDQGEPTKAALGFAKSCQTTIEQLERQETAKGEWLIWKGQKKGADTLTLLPDLFRQALNRLPIAKRMRWGSGDAEFVRPVHWLVVLWGNTAVPMELFGCRADKRTYGHRFHAPGAIELTHPSEYLDKLKDIGWVQADFSARRENIRQQIEKLAFEQGGQVMLSPALLDEVTALVEWPVALLAHFDEEFLQVPAEALESAIQGHQKCFPVMDSQGKLMPLFIAVSNIASKDMALVKQGNERVMRPRLSDSAFFWQQDRKQPLINQLERLKNVVFQAKLGSVYDKVVRVENLAVTLAKWLQVKEDFVRRAAQLAKCDLMTDMVGECPELEGTMGRYYALADGEPIEVAMAIEEHYQPRVAGGDLPAGDVGQVLAVADKLDTLASLFVLGKVPTGDKDPFALRRAALGVMRILVEKQLLVSLPQLITAAFSAFSLPSDLSQDDLVSRLHTFMLERLRGWLLDQDVSLEVFDAVQVCQNAEPYDMLQRMKAVDHFRQQPEAEQLTAANKRIHNILKKSAEGQSFDEVNADVLVDKAEKDLYQQAMALQETASCLLTARDYQPLLLLLAKLQPPIDAFFDQVMVMSDDPQLQQNRLALLSMIRQHFLQVADISLLS